MGVALNPAPPAIFTYRARSCGALLRETTPNPVLTGGKRRQSAALGCKNRLRAEVSTGSCGRKHASRHRSLQGSRKAALDLKRGGQTSPPSTSHTHYITGQEMFTRGWTGGTYDTPRTAPDSSQRLLCRTQTPGEEESCMNSLNLAHP